MTKFEVRIFAGNRTSPRTSRNFTVESDLPLQEIAKRVEIMLQTCDTSANQKPRPAGSKEDVCHIIEREGEKPQAWKN